ncbi:YdeI/OmpD-associated family protein [Wenyingzhuangia sp. chi5]|uniref:YdeI/OmpD-associated family protein n=1 Tax=Wenyingzhuangia gilva TaxID=3057677 RepID=A0ABT8VUA4_9FLAO|nr:YdeI/OmpD-associated family protein [Wenyingzhuangia sp. chi5]MDO3695543.1 YdeI/OmpD-associated family protein [Wenyingzhuangia sp. chi5]
MTKKEKINSFYPSNQLEWRLWLENNHISKDSVWVLFYKKHTNKPTISWSDAVDQALCFGWIDSTKKPIDSEKYIQYFCKRKPKSNWSKVNKDKIETLTKQGLMKEAGMESVKTAKQNGSWTILDTVEALIIPQDLEIALSKHKNAKDFFMSLSKSLRKILLYKIISAKKPETRQKRIDEIALQMENHQKP